jgi:multicomponent K+:H+ antiporter subunit E
MSRLFAFPVTSAGLLILWLLLNQSLSPGHLLLGAAVALAGGWFLGSLQLPGGRLRRPRVVAALAGSVVSDIVRSNIAVARIILGFEARKWMSGFVEIPLELRSPYGLAALAGIITSTPGTVWVDYNATTGTLTIHVLDLIDPAEWHRTIKERYEARLLEIFR